MLNGSLEGSVSDLWNQGYLDFDRDLFSAVARWVVSSFVDEGQALDIEIERDGRVTSWETFRERSDASKRRRV